MKLCNKVAVLRDGVMVHGGDIKDITKADMIKHMVGREMTNIYPTVEKTITDEVIFEAKDIRVENFDKDVSLKLCRGEIVGLYGLMGAGRTELARVFFGVDECRSGRIWVHGKEIEKMTPQVAIENGMAFVTEDRRDEGLLMSKSVADNLSLVALKKLTKKANVVDRKTEKKWTLSSIDALKIKVSDHKTQRVMNLSGGNQQKVVFGKWTMNEPDIFFLDEPTRGVDVGAKFEIYNIIVQMAKDGAAILMISSEMEELIGVCDKIMVFSNGEIKGEIAKEEYNQEQIMRLAL